MARSVCSRSRSLARRHAPLNSSLTRSTLTPSPYTLRRHAGADSEERRTLMGFGLNLNITGDFLPIVKIDARTGRIVRVDRDEGGEQRLVDMTDVFEGVFDLAHAEAGWAYFEDGQA